MGRILSGSIVGLFVFSLSSFSLRPVWGGDLPGKPAIPSPTVRGQELFEREWKPGDPRAAEGDGLGPMFNDISCKACHSQGGLGGAGAIDKNVVLIMVQFDPTGISTPQEIANFPRLHPDLRGASPAMLHKNGTSPAYAAWFEERFPKQNFAAPASDSLTTLTENEQDPHVRRATLQSQAWQVTVERELKNVPYITAQRNSTALFGAGLLEAIPTRSIIEAEKEKFPNWPNVKGRALRRNVGRIGRFGWKGQKATLAEFVRGACAAELGLHVAGASQPPDIMLQVARIQGTPAKTASRAPKGDLQKADVDALTAFVAALPRPSVREPANEQERQRMAHGRELFEQVGCAACHRSVLGELEGAFTDLLVHEMGEPLALGQHLTAEQQTALLGPGAQAILLNQYFEARGEDNSDRGQWRTAPLWGLRDSAPYLHDGRAQTIEQAIAFHEGESMDSSTAYLKLAPSEREDVLFFLNSLIAPTNAIPVAHVAPADNK